ncbi:hypothetical protein BpHYR1_037880 [Brachionus plicatilis]|uniref:HTH psq-type domain-containing protein n=1 Tax=Brachionus plicatilis TaxID=10195 RepID=A0A3M7RIE2_BRAPC|nr:hypothetical protein BpHYR1_037880 [Brachionus plicatilis]
MVKIDLEKRVKNFFKNIPFESLFLGLLTASSTFCGKSTIKATPGFKQPFSLYSVFVGGISSRKSNCIELIKDEFTKVFKICSLLKINDENRSLMQFWDEFQTLLSSYSKYNSDGNFSRSFILSVYNGSKDYSIHASFGKATGQLVRLSGVIHCLDQKMNILTEIDNINELDYEELTKILVDKTYSNIITRKNVEKAINLNEYFLKQKLYLAGFIELTNTNQLTEIVHLCGNLSKKLTIDEIIEAKILISLKNSIVYLSEFSRKKFGKELDFIRASEFESIIDHRKSAIGIEYKLKFDSSPYYRWVQENFIQKWPNALNVYLKRINNRDESKCNVDKDLCFNKRKTGGIVTGITSCGLILHFNEIVKEESLSSLQYNACHLSEYIDKHSDNISKELIFLIDRFHLRNHTRDTCRVFYSCDNYGELNDLNTQTCEQIFSDISRYKHSCISPETKIEIIKKHCDQKITTTTLSKEYGVNTSTISTILSSKAKISEPYEKNLCGHEKKRIKLSSYDDVLKSVLCWFEQVQKYTGFNGDFLFGDLESECNENDDFKEIWTFEKKLNFEKYAYVSIDSNLPARGSLSDIKIINSISNAENKDDSDSEVEDITKPKKSDFSSKLLKILY